jgi:hypothetical protein
MDCVMMIVLILGLVALVVIVLVIAIFVINKKRQQRNAYSMEISRTNTHFGNPTYDPHEDMVKIGAGGDGSSRKGSLYEVPDGPGPQEPENVYADIAKTSSFKDVSNGAAAEEEKKGSVYEKGDGKRAENPYSH